MTRLRYTVCADAHGGYTIEVWSGSAVVELISGFPDEHRANSWIEKWHIAEFAKPDPAPDLAPE